MTMTQKKPFLGPLILLFFSLYLCWAGFGNIYINSLYSKNSVRTTVATITSFSRSSGGRGGTILSIEYTFKTSQGETITGNASGYSGQKGETVLIEYLSHDPHQNRVAGSDKRGKSFFLPIGIIGIIFLVASIYSAWKVYLRSYREHS